MEYGFDTKCCHCVTDIVNEHSFGAVAVPIYQTATFAHRGIGESTGYNYTRTSNPTRDEVEKVVAQLEGADRAFSCVTGMAAIALVLELFGDGDHIIASEDLYGGTVRLFDKVGTRHGVECTYVNTGDYDAVCAALKENTKALYIETPSNPMMQVTDLRQMRRLADEKGLLVIVDNTFLSPYFQRPIELGADIVVHSGTKFLCGHNDTVAGFVCSANAELSERLAFLNNCIGYGLAPFDSYMILRGIKTLSLRMERAQQNAIKIAEWLDSQEKIARVYYTGLPSHPGYEVNLSQASGFGSMISFTTDCEATARRILERVHLIIFAESLGGVESLITYPMLQTHADVPVEVRERLGINERFLRMSVGIECADDLIADLDQAMNGD